VRLSIGELSANVPSDEEHLGFSKTTGENGRWISARCKIDTQRKYARTVVRPSTCEVNFRR
jgi:hypothetical protein